jgi:hypothetical protein
MEIPVQEDSLVNEVMPLGQQRWHISTSLTKLARLPYPQKVHLLFEALWCLAIILQIVVVLGVPLFPSQDGPMHLYYVDLLRSLITGKGAYAKYYVFGHPLPPYLFQYGLTLLIEAFCAPLVAEKIAVVLYTVWFAASTRYLARSLGPGWRLSALISVAFALHRWVYMGFFNFSIALATSFFLIGYWSRHARPVLTPRRSLVFSFLLALLATMHPVPVLFVVAYVAIYTIGALSKDGSALADGVRNLQGWALLRTLVVLLPFLLCIAIVLWIHAITIPLTGPAITAWISRADLADRVKSLARLLPILPLTSGIYRKSVAFLLGVLVWLCIRIPGRKRTAEANDQSKLPILLTTAACMVIYIVAPNWFSGGSYFPQRFCIFAFLLGIKSLAFSETRGRAEALSMAAAALLTVIVVLPLWNTNRALAKEIAPFLNTPLIPPGSRGVLIMQPASWPADLSAGCNFSAEFHAAMHIFRRSQAVLLNAPWNALPTTPIITRYNFPESDAVDTLGSDIARLRAKWNSTSSENHIDFIVVIKQHGSLPPMVAQFAREAGLIDVAGYSDQFAMLVAPARRY